MKKVLLSKESTNILKECEYLFPEGFPVYEKPERELVSYHNLNLFQKLIFAAKTFFQMGHWCWYQNIEEVDPEFYLLDSSGLTFQQNQAVLIAMKEKVWGGQIPKWVNPDDPVNNLKIFVNEVID